MNKAMENNAVGSIMEEDGKYQELSVQTTPSKDADTIVQVQSTITKYILPPNFKLNADSTRLDKLRLDLFKTVLEGSCEDVRKALEEVHASNISLIASEMLDPRNDMNVLHLALDRKRMDIAEIFIKECDNDILNQMFTLPNGSRTALHQITEAGDLSLVKRFLNRINNDMAKEELILNEAEFHIEDGRPRFINALHLAAFKGFTDIVKFFLHIGIKVNIETRKGNTALHWAAREGHIDTIVCLLDNGADANFKNDSSKKSSSTALHWAMRANQTESVNLLLAKGNADPNQPTGIGLQFPITIASSLGNSAIVECLINHGARINDLENEKPSALYHAAKGGHVEVVKLLLKHDARYRKGLDEDIESKNPDEDNDCKYPNESKDRKNRDEDRDGNNALLIAAKTNAREIVQELLAHGDDITRTNNLGHDVLYFALTNEDSCLLEDIVKHLKKKKYNFSKFTPPVCVAARLGKNDKIKSLIDMGMKPHIKDFRRNTFVHYAAQHNQHEVIKHFSQYANIDAKNNNGDTALHVACKEGNLLAVQELINQGAKTTVTNKDNETILHAAASSKSNTTKELCEFLIDNFIKVHDWDTINYENEKGQSALHVAASLADPDVIYEFRKIRNMDQDNENNTPFHCAVRTHCEQALDTMLKIYTNTDKDVDLNIKNTNGETVMHLAVSSGFKDTIKRLIENGADLGSQDKDEDTVLHRLVRSMVEDTENDELYLQVVDLIFDNSVVWWCKKKDINIPTEDQVGRKIKLHKEAILSLVEGYLNKNKLSVVSYAFKLGADKFLSKFLTMENVMHILIKDKYCYDITGITPSTSERIKRRTFDCRGCKTTSKSHIERLLQCTASDRVGRVLDIPPIHEIEKLYSRVCGAVHLLLLILHIAYMSVFTHVGIQISTKFGEMAKGNTDSTDFSSIMPYFTLILIEPIVYLMYVSNGVIRYCKRKEKPSEFIALNLTVATLYSLIMIAWIVLFAVRCYYQDCVLAVTLCLGWMVSLSLIRYKPVHFLYRLCLHIILKDISRLFLVFGFVWLGFGAAFHVLMRVSTELSETYETMAGTLYMLFTIAVGMFEINEDWAKGMEAENRHATFMKGVALVYIIVGTVILMNLLIAIMNDSFAKVYNNQQIYWRIDTLRIAVELNYLLKNSMFRNSAMQKKSTRGNRSERWHICVHDENNVNKQKLKRMVTSLASLKIFSRADTKTTLSRREETRTPIKKSHLFVK